ncbi:MULTISPECIES: PH domain-containing protein [unclassified Rhodococcus (in: high G+C Gram-positive bacteria)]|uniref:PH domain-containing protein n=1 Tax=unclassified Rhodococcus (in: high G+C Gram-positive bacteria) TaxID=192944 RepID=UPI00146C31A5|nr:PH domain-containing protein [Rhodococcus sp. (in: high G+C Gram-positive bacteria)]MBF0661850.1 PH domain-containing protein [Rhodococcus sp. (in: high G+C Gram-positive bacteria)]NMD94294.1 PH domain-containing protein [Rhodococcus sp. BL-253-APC-6A1W]NME78550.1 PH domain-containing protein [Rhodococcus sp. 105337]
MPPPPSSHMPDSTTQVIQISRLSFLACGLLFLALASPALAWPEAFAWTLVIPFLVAAWVVRVRTVVGPDGVVARSTFSTTTIPWESLKGIRFPKRGWARATLTDDSEVPLPVVTFGRLPQLAEASGGRITDPYAAADDARAAEAAAAERSPAKDDTTSGTRDEVSEPDSDTETK